MKDNFEKFGSKKERKFLPEKLKRVEKVLEEAGAELKKISTLFNQKGFLVDEECRLDLEKLKKIKGLYAPKVVESDKKRVATRKKEIEAERERLLASKNFDGVFLQKIGELTEKLKTISFNKFWFKDRFFGLRTSFYDDYFNGIDEIILDPKTPRVVAAIDITSKKEALRSKIDELRRKTQNPQSIKLDYGVVAKETKEGLKITYQPLKEIPLLIFAFEESYEKTLEWWQAIKNEDKKFLDDLLKKEVWLLKEQCRVCSESLNIPKSLRREYQALFNFFSKVLEEK